jgi:hypothetical protein
VSAYLNPVFFKTSSFRKLINASGSGKTRLLFEGLRRQAWGFYFTARRASASAPDGSGDLTGSTDLSNLITAVRDSQSFTVDVHSGLPPNDLVAARAHNDKVALRRCAELLTARFILLEIFLQEVERLDAIEKRGIDWYRGHWLYLQLLPVMILTEDPFDSLCKALRGADCGFLGIGAPGKASEIRENILKKIPSLTYVIDEAQVLASSLELAFMSSDSEAPEARPLLRQILLGFGKMGDQIILSGTGMSINKIGRVTSSSVLKRDWRPFQEVMSLDSAEAQARYLSTYLPRKFIESEVGKDFLRRVWEWARGRCVEIFTRCQVITVDLQVSVYRSNRHLSPRIRNAVTSSNFKLLHLACFGCYPKRYTRISLR